MNTTYARRIKRGQQALIAGYTDLVNIFALAEGVAESVIGNFNIRITPIITVEDNRRDELLQTKIRNSNDIMDLLGELDDIIEPETKLEVILNWLTSYLGQQETANIIKQANDKKDDNKLNNTNEEDDKNMQDIARRRINRDRFSSPPSMGDSNIDINIENEEPINDEEETTPELEIPPQVDLNSIEGADLT